MDECHERFGRGSGRQLQKKGGVLFRERIERLVGWVVKHNLWMTTRCTSSRIFFVDSFLGLQKHHFGDSVDILFLLI